MLYRQTAPHIDGKESKDNEPVIVKEHIFCLSDDTTQNHHFVHHLQGLIFNYLREWQHFAAIIGCAKYLYEYLSVSFQEPTSTSQITPKIQKYLHIPSEGEGAVPRKRQSGSFKGIRKMQSVQITQHSLECSQLCM